MGLSSEKPGFIANCGSGAISVILRCTDLSIPGETTVGQRSEIVNLAPNDGFSVAFVSPY